MFISIYGAGYVGLVSAACLAKLGHHVVCADINTKRIDALLAGHCPIYEKQLPELLQEQVADNRLHFTADLSKAIQQAQVHIIATGTPSLTDGSADLSQVFAVAKRIAEEAQQDILIITKSTVPVGTGDAIQTYVNEQISRDEKKIRINVASNPEFLREGTAVYDFLNADRIIIGGEEDSYTTLRSIYEPLIKQGIPFLCMSRRSAELTKYSANAMLACRISFINQISQLAEVLGANIDEVREGIALDERIGPYFLQAGIGYGGSCFPKDISALRQTAKIANIDTSLLDAIDAVNQQQKNWVFEHLSKHFANELQGLTIGIWGLAFKPGTDDLREASSLVAIDALLNAGVKLRVYDPVAIPAAKKIIGKNAAIDWCDSAEDVFDDKLHALVIVTEWPLFKNYDLARLKKELADTPLFDGRNCFELAEVIKAELTYYYSVGRPNIINSLTD